MTVLVNLFFFKIIFNPSDSISTIDLLALEGLAQWSTGEACLAPVPSSTFHVHPVTPAVSYLSTGLARCLVDPGNSRGACKLARTPRVIKKKKIC